MRSSCEELKRPAGLQMGRAKTAFSCDWQKGFYVVHEGHFLCALNFHWDLLYMVDMSECEKGSFWGVSVPKPSAAAIFFIFTKYAPVFSNKAFPTTCASHRHCHVRTYVPMRSTVCAHVPVNVPWRNIMEVHKYVNVLTPPYPTPPLRDMTHLQRSMTRVRTCK